MNQKYFNESLGSGFLSLQNVHWDLEGRQLRIICFMLHFKKGSVIQLAPPILLAHHFTSPTVHTASDVTIRGQQRRNSSQNNKDKQLEICDSYHSNGSRSASFAAILYIIMNEKNAVLN
ncbi:hypothetical protein CHARACLAT_003065 [Characodon lateralis]|uniref:Uncharacterized protein n=1 Tax=Characodon lateralis TaxID=208331 RepID=A0ABU7CXE7_9TELE|nr:hypothetical protein [Characodon lateralis]